MKFDFEKFNEQAEDKAGDSFPRWKPKDGDNLIRILPPTKKAFEEAISYFAEEQWVHFLPAENPGERKFSFRCLRDKGENCPACTAWFDLKELSEEDPAYSELQKEISRSNRFSVNILDLEDPESGVQIYEFGIKIYRELKSFIGNPKWGLLLSPEEGRDWTLNKSYPNGPKGWPAYSVVPDPSPRDITDLLPEGWKDELDKLESVIKEYASAEEVLRHLEAIGAPTQGATSANPKTPPTVKKVESVNKTVQKEEKEFTGQLPWEDKEEDTADEDAPESAQEAAEEPSEEPEDAEAEEEVEEPVAASQKGPELGPDGTPVCFGEHDPSQYPCSDCDEQAACIIENIGVG